MEKYVMAALSALVFSAFLVLVIRSWRSRATQQAGVIPKPVDSLVMGEYATRELEARTFEALYHATTVADEPLNRVVVHGLGFRSRVDVRLSNAGIEIAGPQLRFAITASQLLGAEASALVIDRAVERDGLVAVRWRNGIDLESYFRFFSADDQRDFLAGIPAREGSGRA